MFRHDKVHRHENTLSRFETRIDMKTTLPFSLIIVMRLRFDFGTVPI